MKILAMSRAILSRSLQKGCELRFVVNRGGAAGKHQYLDHLVSNNVHIPETCSQSMLEIQPAGLPRNDLAD